MVHFRFFYKKKQNIVNVTLKISDFGFNSVTIIFKAHEFFPKMTFTQFPKFFPPKKKS